MTFTLHDHIVVLIYWYGKLHFLARRSSGRLESLTASAGFDGTVSIVESV